MTAAANGHNENAAGVVDSRGETGTTRTGTVKAMESTNDSDGRIEGASASAGKRSYAAVVDANRESAAPAPALPATPAAPVDGDGCAKQMVMLQVAIYVLIAVVVTVSCLFDRRLGFGFSGAIPLVLMLVVMRMWPLYSSFVDAIVGVVGGIVMIFGTGSLLMSALPRNDQAAGQRTAPQFAGFGTVPASVLMHVYTVWAVALLVVLTAFVILGFLHQMLRRERTNMVLSLSHSLLLDVALAGVSGWVFSPLLFRYFGARSLGAKKPWIVAIVVVAAVAVLAGLSWASTRWFKDYAAAGMPLSSLYHGNRDRKRQSCAAIALIPLMFAGFVVFLALVALLVSVG
ncbi:hypothetical protein OZX72_01405 [Bifidobacterium sp. ESL0769]|uniref:hypothetical protein n=1 Tax=Bifidobacterium sp. ESL0769 TaxID=2983229 RepID=UPI0023F96C40|nr:hypothetical protein [Bifidobacterium sp. ESL0769]WEV67686.1 hypothetical protein OZX72_01405 [Bifidobacterium sp. ESL0769]